MIFYRIILYFNQSDLEKQKIDLVWKKLSIYILWELGLGRMWLTSM